MCIQQVFTFNTSNVHLLNLITGDGPLGYIAIDDGFKYDIEGVPKEIRVEHSEVNCKTHLKATRNKPM